MSLSEDGFGAELAYLLTVDVRTPGEEDLRLTSTSGNLKLDGTAVEMTGDLIINSNLIVNNSVNFQDMNIFRLVLDTVYNRGKYVTKPTRPVQSQSPD